MNKLLQILFSPPQPPPIEFPPFVTAKLKAGILSAIVEALRTAYYRGVFDGLVAGILLMMLLFPSLRGQATKGVTSALSHL